MYAPEVGDAVGKVPESATVSLRLGDGSRTCTSLWEVQARQVVGAIPWRATDRPALPGGRCLCW